MISTDHDAVWDMDSGGPKEPCIRWETRIPYGNGDFLRGSGQHTAMRPVCNFYLGNLLQVSVTEV